MQGSSIAIWDSLVHKGFNNKMNKI
jgi:hypothetical protein